jgi:O-antigen/teichoic acid export membrane protein
MTILEISYGTPAVARRLTLLLASLASMRGVLVGAAQVLAVRIVGAGLSYASMVLLARWLGTHDFGIYAYILVIITLLGLAFSFGFNSSTLRFAADYLARGKRRRLAGFLNVSFAASLLFSTLGPRAIAGVVVALRSSIEPYYVMPLLVGLLCVPLWTLLNQLEATARAFGWVNAAYLPGYVVRPFVLIALVSGGALIGHSASALTGVLALMGACAAAAIVQAALVLPGVRLRLNGAKPIRHPRRWAGVSLGFLTIDGFRMLLDNTDILLIGQFLDPHSVAIYFAVIRTSGLVAFISFSVVALAVPKFAEIHSTGTREELQAFVSSATRMMFWPSLVAAVAMAGAGPFVLSWFGADFTAGYPAMLVVLTGLVLRTATMPVEHLLSMSGYHRDTIKVYACAAAASLVLNLMLIPACGILGAAIATYVAMIGGNIYLCKLVQKRLAINVWSPAQIASDLFHALLRYRGRSHVLRD